MQRLAPRAANSSPFDLLRVCFSTDFVTLASSSDDFMAHLLERIKLVRRHIYSRLGYNVPGVRLEDRVAQKADYVIFVREVPVAKGCLQYDSLIAIAKDFQTLEPLEGSATLDPTYSMPSLWIPPKAAEQARTLGCFVCKPLDVLATHLTQTIKLHAHKLLGIEESAQLLDQLNQPRLVGEVVPTRVSLPTLKNVLRALLKEQVSILDLGLILDTLADVAHPSTSVEDLVGKVRVSLRETLVQDYLNDDLELQVYEWNDHLHPEQLEAGSIVLSEASSRLDNYRKFPHLVVLSREEIPEWVRLLPLPSP